MFVVLSSTKQGIEREKSLVVRKGPANQEGERLREMR